MSSIQPLKLSPGTKKAIFELQSQINVILFVTAATFAKLPRHLLNIRKDEQKDQFMRKEIYKEAFYE